MNNNHSGVAVKICIALCIIAAFLCGSSYLTKREEPTYKGRTPTQWFQHAIQTESKTHTRDDTAIQNGLLALGTNPVATLTLMLESHDSALKQRLMKFMTSINNTAYLTSDEKRYIASRGFVLLATNVPHVDSELAHLATSPDENTREFAIELLGEINSNPAVLLNALTEMYKHDPKRRLRKYAAIKIISDFPEEAAPLGVYNAFPELRMIQ